MKWYEKGWVIFLWIIFFFPVGLFLLWKYAHCRNLTKMVITALFIVITPITILPVSENTSTVLGIIAIIIALAAIICYVHKIQKKYESIFINWNGKIHNTDEQGVRIYRTLHDNLSIHCFTENESAEVTGTSGEIYQVTFQNCTCPDFEKRQQPCKHMYFLAKELKKLSNFELQLFCKKPKNKRNGQKKEQYTVHGNKFDFIVTSYETEGKPTKKDKIK